MRKLFSVIVLVLGVIAFAGFGFSEGRVLFDFEQEDLSGWEIPDWAFEQDDYVAEDVAVSADYSKTGAQSMKIVANFPGDSWKGSLVEVMEYFDWTPYGEVSCDVYLPKDAPVGLKAKLILTVGDNWKWTEMSRSFALAPGEWTTISADLKPGSSDWKRTMVTDEFRADVRKIAVRVESNRKPMYYGPIYVDNVRLQ